jgi:hypothetical protein
MKRRKAPFWERVKVSDGCWEWTGPKDMYGYGLFYEGGRQKTTHRLSWTMHFGCIPPAMLVCHRCDNPACVRPNHLFLGTHQDNMADKIAKGRAAGGSSPGEANPLAKLTDDIVRTIRAEYLPGKRGHGSAAAKRFGVSISTVHLVLRNKIWRHI